MKKSKKLYIAVLVSLLSIALIDHLDLKKEDQQISVGKSEEGFITKHFAQLYK